MHRLEGEFLGIREYISSLIWFLKNGKNHSFSTLSALIGVVVHTRVLCEEEDEASQESEGGGGGGRGRDDVGGLGAGVDGGASPLSLLVHAELHRMVPSFLVIFLLSREVPHMAHLKHCGLACQCCSCRETRCSSGLMYCLQVLHVCAEGERMHGFFLLKKSEIRMMMSIRSFIYFFSPAPT